MIGGLFRRSLFKLDLGMEEKTVFCGIVNKIVYDTNQTHTIAVDSSKIHTAHLIYYCYGSGNTIIYNSSYTYDTSFDIVLNSGKSTYFYRNHTSSHGMGFCSYNYNSDCPYGLIHNGSTITLKYEYNDASNQASSSNVLILLIIKEHDVIM